MTHPTKELLVALADGELDATEEARTLRHLEACTTCAATLAEVQETRAAFASVLGTLDAAEPPAWVLAADRLPDLPDSIVLADELDDATFAHARDVDVVDIGRERATRSERPGNGDRSMHAARRTPRRSAPPAWRWAAAILVTSAAAAAVLREPLANVLRRGGGPDVAITAVQPPAQTPPAGGVLLTPVDGAAEIELANGAAGTRIGIGYHDRAEILVEATSEGTPQFTHDAGRGAVRADLAGARHDLRIVVPADLRRLRIVADGAVLAVIEAGRLTESATDRGYVIEAESSTGR
jgi:hypothetical protein